MNIPIDFSGERFVPGVKGDIELEHLHRYYVAESLTRGKIVADIACGEGYGSAILAATAKHVTGIDLSEEAVARAKQKYSSENLDFLIADAIKTPLANHSVDVIVSFETIEHHSFHHEMMNEIVRILRPGGLLIISSPDKYECTDKTGRINPFHVKELYKQEFLALLSDYFSNVSLHGQRVQISSIVDGDLTKDSRIFGSYRLAEKNENLVPSLVPDPMFWIGLASNSALPELGTSALVDPSEVEILRSTADRSIELERFVEHQARDIITLKEALQTLGEEKVGQERLIAKLNLEIGRLDHSLAEESSKLSQANSHIHTLSERLDSILGSSSWRITAPFRFISKLIRNR